MEGLRRKTQWNCTETIDSASFASILNEGITEHELHNAKEQLKADFCLGLKVRSLECTAMGKMNSFLREHKTIDEVVRSLTSVKAQDVYTVYYELLTKKRATPLFPQHKLFIRIEN